VARKARRSRGQEPMQGSGSRPESARGVCDGSPQNRRVTWLSHKTRPEARRAETESERAEKLLMPGDTRRDHGACIRRMRTMAKA
jgi:hypothetical protein